MSSADVEHLDIRCSLPLRQRNTSKATFMVLFSDQPLVRDFPSAEVLEFHVSFQTQGKHIVFVENLLLQPCVAFLLPFPDFPDVIQPSLCLCLSLPPLLQPNCYNIFHLTILILAQFICHVHSCHLTCYPNLLPFPFLTLCLVPCFHSLTVSADSILGYKFQHF